MASTVLYRRGAAAPALLLEWLDTDGAPVDLTSGSFTLYLRDTSLGDAELTKTTGVTGSVDGILTVAWADNDLDLLETAYELLVHWSNGDRWWPGDLLLKVLPVPVSSAP
jgi:hypothetical protein